jgi:DNA-binding winged helix-turn-helix (wHTH) protein
MSYIFISYSHNDSAYTHKLANSLEERGFEVWIGERIDYGTRWPHVIQEHVDGCSAFVVVMTPNSYESEWVQNELVRAKRKRKPIFPLLLEGSEPWLSVEATQCCDVRAGKLPPADFYARLATVVPVRTLVSETASEGVYLDETTGEIWVDGNRITEDLTGLPHDLLVLLWRKQGGVCSKAEIAEALWPDARGGITDVQIDYVVHRLRKQVGSYLITLRGRGYRLEMSPKIENKRPH